MLRLAAAAAAGDGAPGRRRVPLPSLSRGREGRNSRASLCAEMPPDAWRGAWERRGDVQGPAAPGAVEGRRARSRGLHLARIAPGCPLLVLSRSSKSTLSLLLSFTFFTQFLWCLLLTALALLRTSLFIYGSVLLVCRHRCWHCLQGFLNLYKVKKGQTPRPLFSLVSLSPLSPLLSLSLSLQLIFSFLEDHDRVADAGLSGYLTFEKLSLAMC